MTAVYRGLLVSLVLRTLPSLTEDESTISLKATARLETAYSPTPVQHVRHRLQSYTKEVLNSGVNLYLDNTLGCALRFISFVTIKKLCSFNSFCSIPIYGGTRTPNKISHPHFVL